jgi:hypothetical protein
VCVGCDSLIRLVVRALPAYPVTIENMGNCSSAASWPSRAAMYERFTPRSASARERPGPPSSDTSRADSVLPVALEYQGTLPY